MMTDGSLRPERSTGVITWFIVHLFLSLLTLSSYSVPGTVLGARTALINKTSKKPLPP